MRITKHTSNARVGPHLEVFFQYQFFLSMAESTLVYVQVTQAVSPQKEYQMPRLFVQN